MPPQTFSYSVFTNSLPVTENASTFAVDAGAADSAAQGADRVKGSADVHAHVKMARATKRMTFTPQVPAAMMS